MEEKLILNSIEDAEIISVRLSPDETPIAYKNKIGAGLMAVDPAAVESGTIWSPYTRELYHENHDT
jgi:hypothetical protein